MIQRGDTIIEVILAVTIFSLVAVGALTLMNSGTSMSQRSLETTLVRQQIDTQAELLRFVSRSAVGTTWDDVKAKAKNHANIYSRQRYLSELGRCIGRFCVGSNNE